MINREELESFVDSIKKENINKKEKIFNEIQVEEILFLKDRKISQKNIIEFLFSKYPEIEKKYNQKISTLKSLISKVKVKKEPVKKIKEKIVKSEDKNEEEIIKNEDEKAIKKHNIASFFG